ncbi:MAG: hypothetical protein IPL88_06520 [Rhizobiales bacterium]|nr:hypothetical protein [Hyphomicrobiales bacterium]
MSNALLSLPPDAREQVRRKLERGEVVRWAGKPRWTAAIPAIALTLAFGLVWTGFAVVWEGAALGFAWDAFIGENRSKTPRWIAGLMAAFGLPFVLIGLGMLYQPVKMLRRARRLVYAVTDRRLIEIVGAEATSTWPASIRNVRRLRLPIVGGSIVVSHGRARTDGDMEDVTTRLDGVDDNGAEQALNALAAAATRPQAA